MQTKDSLDRIDAINEKPPAQTRGYDYKRDGGNRLRSNQDSPILAHGRISRKKESIMNEKSQELSSCNFLDKVGFINEKPSVEAEGLDELRDDGPSPESDRDNQILARGRISRKKENAVERSNFVFLFRDAKSLYVEDPKLYFYLIYFAHFANRTWDDRTGLEPGECLIPENIPGLTRKEKREAQKRAIKNGHVLVVFNPKWKIASDEQAMSKWQKRAIKRAIKCMVVKLINTDTFDINQEVKGHQKGQRGAIKGPSKGHTQEDKNIRRKKSIYTLSSLETHSIKESSSSSEESKMVMMKKYLSKGWKEEEFLKSWEVFLNQEKEVTSFSSWFETVLQTTRMKMTKDFEKKQKEKKRNVRNLDKFQMSYPGSVEFKEKEYRFLTGNCDIDVWKNIHDKIENSDWHAVECEIRKKNRL